MIRFGGGGGGGAENNASASPSPSPSLSPTPYSLCSRKTINDKLNEGKIVITILYDLF